MARTTIRLYQGATPLTLIEEKLEGDASVMMRDPRKRTWLLDTLRDVERRTGMKLFRTAEDAQITDGDIKEAWSHLGQYYFVGRAKHGDAATLARWKEKGFREMFADIMGSKAGPTMQAYETFFRSVWRRGAELEEMRRAGTLDADLEGALRRSLGMGDGEMTALNSSDMRPDAHEAIALKPGEKLWEEDGVSFAVAPVPFADNVDAAVKGRLPANAILDMGRPGEVLRKAGVPDLPMWIRLSKVRKKRGKHSELTEEVMKKFPEAMDYPMLVYVSPWDRKAHSIVTSLATSQGPLTAYFTVHGREGQQVLEAKTLFGKEPGELLAEIREAERLGRV
ncbi:hypothetical protein [Roseimicrobium gellanilyticum]|uniref:hypothetical protein n=1 Tax=Roseimicrobium gellanilyticum TaxID=748857 RepID=UPI000DEA1FC8|nr:hypothetical protein [Roseimicrobium gellanilyticum]